MAAAADAADVGPLEDNTQNPNKTPYANMLKPIVEQTQAQKILPKPVIMIHGEPNITWKTTEVRNLIIQENLQYAIIGKFSYGKPNINELRKVIPSQCGIKGGSNIGLLDSRHILIRLSLLEDYVQMLSNPCFYLKTKEDYWQMRTLKWDPWFEPDVETSIGVAWISFPDLPPNFFAREAIFSIASAVGRLLTVDMATMNKTRPSCAKVKVEVDLIAKLPHRVKINEENEYTGEIKSKWIKIQYDYMPKYCRECCLQGYDESNCKKLYPEGSNTKQKEKIDYDEEAQENNERAMREAKEVEPGEIKVLKSGKVVGNYKNINGWRTRKNQYIKEKSGVILGKINEGNGVNINNSFAALEEENGEGVQKDVEDTTKLEQQVAKTNEEDTKGRTSKVNSQIEKQDSNAHGSPLRINTNDKVYEKGECSSAHGSQEHQSKLGKQPCKVENVRKEVEKAIQMKVAGDTQTEDDMQESTEGNQIQRTSSQPEQDLEKVMKQVGKDGDLSPRHIQQMKSGAKKQPHTKVPLQVKTRSNKDNTISSDQ